jgi:hypothetical protein
MKAAIPAYLALYSRVNDLMSAKFQLWAYEVTITGRAVYIHHRENVGLAREIIKAAGLSDQVRVHYSDA